MRCIFCKENSSDSKSVEHIIPESLGGKKHTLPVGIVCDKCNNDFAREVEKPFLENELIKLLRFEQSLESKKGIIPSTLGVLNTSHPVYVWKELRSGFAGHIDVDISAYNSILATKKNMLIFPKYSDEMLVAESVIVSRFIGKIAIEAFAQRIMHLGLDQFIDDVQFNSLRNHVRRQPILSWICNVRRIYETNKIWIDSNTGETYQVMNEWDFLYTEEKEFYFIVAIFGTEYAINMGDGTIDGYNEWLSTHNNESPLYVKDEN